VLDGVDLDELGVGSRLRVGPVLLELTQLGKVCHNRCAIYYTAGDCIMPRTGLFARVLEGGEVRPGDAVEVVEAVKAVPLGRQSGLRPVEVLGVELDARNDPAVTLGQRRRAAKAVGDMRRADALRAVMNALVWGNPARFDPGGEAGEGPGPWCWPPLAATVAAGARCLMALAEAEVGPLAYVDTDGFIAEMGEDRQ